MGSIIDDIKNAFHKTNNSSVQLILVNVFVFGILFLAEFFLSFSAQTKPLVSLIHENSELNARLPDFLVHPWTLFTFGYINESFWGLLFNVISLYFFGLLMQEFLGSRKLFNVYILGYLFSGLFYLVCFNLVAYSKSEFHLLNPVSGANAGVYAVMFATVALIPDYEFYFFRLFFIRIKYIALLLLALSFLNVGTGLVNLGGAFMGYFYIKMLKTGIDFGSPIETVSNWFSGVGRTKTNKQFTSKKYSHSTIGNTVRSELSVSGDFFNEQEEIDLLLDKISESGYNSLSKEEKERLFKVSQSKNLKI